MTSSTPRRSIRSTRSSSSRVPAAMAVSCVSGLTTSIAATRPRIRSRSGSMTSPPSTRAFIA
ncbi:Uncharacterised protein [Bordetella pertussis]|nr:Uncharacterised protein [Bordetella pertussis]